MAYLLKRSIAITLTAVFILTQGAPAFATQNAAGNLRAPQEGEQKTGNA